ncbi:MAG TPA: hypothetical protein VFH72_05220 [Candidatus Baltobacteraceae bacterium]|nr:hypothetical protein [Candidatus Baltobacteraceae bacterium]
MFAHRSRLLALSALVALAASAAGERVERSAFYGSGPQVGPLLRYRGLSNQRG